jgi:RimJ/RimL family protein N-acetyltransferase
MSAMAPDYSNYFWQNEKTRLRPWRLEDAEMRYNATFDSPMYAMAEDGIMLPSSLERQKEWLEKAVGFKDTGALQFAVDTLDGVTVGWVNLHSLDQKNGKFGFGVMVYHGYRGNGYAFDAVRTVLKYGFWEQRYQKCNSTCLHTNTASVRLHQKLDFMQEGRIRRVCFTGGIYLDDLHFGMTREEFDESMKP